MGYKKKIKGRLKNKNKYMCCEVCVCVQEINCNILWEIVYCTLSYQFLASGFSVTADNGAQSSQRN